MLTDHARCARAECIEPKCNFNFICEAWEKPQSADGADGCSDCGSEAAQKWVDIHLHPQADTPPPAIIALCVRVWPPRARAGG